MQNSESHLRNIYAFFSLCNPELLVTINPGIPESDLVAAKLITSLHKDEAKICINTIEDNHYQFDLDLSSRIYQSKGNWIWVKEIEVQFPKEYLFDLTLNPRVIDLPYSNKCLCAHWLFKNMTEELTQLLDNYL